MRVHLLKKTLAETLGHVERIIPPRSSNPTLSLLSLELAENTLVLSGSNGDIDIQATLEADTEGTGQLAIPAQVFGQVIKALPGDTVELNRHEQELSIRSGSYATKLQLVDEAHNLEFSNHYSGALPAKDLEEALSHVRYAAATAEYQAIFRGVKLELADNRTRAIATDGFRLAYYHLEASSGLDSQMVIPARSVDEITRLLGGGEVQLEPQTGQLALATGFYKVNIKLMEGTFPDYERVIPARFLINITLDAKRFYDAVARVAVMADKSSNNRVDLFIKDGNLEINAEGAYGRSQESLEVSQEGSESQMALAYNARYLMDALQPMHGDVRASFSGTTTPSVMASLQDPAYLSMVVPLRTG